MPSPTLPPAEDCEHAFWRDAYKAHGADLLAFLTSRAGSRADAEELLQETFVRAIRSGERLRAPERVRGYLFTTACNLLRNRNRRQRISPEVGGVEGLAEVAPSATTADETARLSAICRRLAGALATLPEAHRRAFDLAVVQRLSYQEVAQRTGWSLASVKVNVFRARRGLVDRLESELGGRRSEES